MENAQDCQRFRAFDAEANTPIANSQAILVVATLQTNYVSVSRFRVVIQGAENARRHRSIQATDIVPARGDH